MGGPEEGNPPYIHIVESRGGQDIIDPEEANWKAEFPLTRIRTIVIGETGNDPGEIISVEILEKGAFRKGVKDRFQ